VARLRRDFAADELQIHEGDVLDFDFADLSRQAQGALRIVGNLPYNISTPLLFHLAECAQCVVDQHFMLQREVVERMTAQPGSSDFSRLSVMLQYRYAMSSVLDVPPEAFDPPPRVHSAVVRMLPHPAAALTAIDERVFAEVVKDGFAQRRKMLRNTLAAHVRAIGGEAAAAALGVDLRARAEDIAVSTWVALANAVVRARAAG